MAERILTDLDSRTEEIQVKLRSDRVMTRIPGCREGSTIPVAMEVLEKIRLFGDPGKDERMARFWADYYRVLLGPLAGNVWPEDDPE